MTDISMIVAADLANGIGKDNQLLCHLPADLSYFKKTTMGKPILMGRKTYESIGRPLPGRKNVVISKTVTNIPGVEVNSSLSQAIEKLVDHPEIMIIGGATIYQQALPLANRIYMTRIHHQFDADVFFPELPARQWKLLQEEHKSADEQNAYAVSYCVYERI